MVIFKNSLIYFKYKLLKNVIDILFQKIIHSIKERKNRFYSSENNQYRSIPDEIKKKFNKHRYRGRKMLLCSAPFKNLYFQPDGNVISCCFNRTFPVGKYPYDSIHDIWKGKKLVKLREYILHDDLSLGCNICYEQIKAGNFDGVGAIYFDKHYINKNGPVMMEFELENTCNLECIMCNGNYSSSIRKNREKLPPLPKIYDENFVKSLEPFLPNLKHVRFLGGEPFLINIYYVIWEKIIALNSECIIDIQTNGTILNQRIKKLVSSGKFKIGVSLDSLNKNIYEKIRVKSKFEKVMENLAFFSNYSKKIGLPLNISVCPMRINWKEIPDLINYCNKINAIIFLNTVYFPSHLALWNLSSKKLREILHYYHIKKIIGSGFITLKNKKHYNDFLDQIQSWINVALKREQEQAEIKNLDGQFLQKKIIQKIKQYCIKEGNRSEDDFQIISDKLSSLLNFLDPGEIKNSVLVTLDSMPVEGLYETLKEKTPSVLKHMLQDYIKKQSKYEPNFVFKY